MKLAAKQGKIADLIRGRAVLQIFLIGALGTGKTLAAAVAMLSVAKNYPDSLVLVGRKNLTELKRGTMFSFREAAQEMGLSDFISENRQDNIWTLTIPGQLPSYIMFVELDHTKDPQFTKIKSINATCAMIDEADGVVHAAHIALFSRTGRRNRNGAPRFILDTCNPNEAWVKSQVYDKWHDPEQHGELSDDMAVIEFDPKDSFLGAGYYEGFANMPMAWKKRYLWNDWNYGDDENSLFKYRHMDRCHVASYKPALRYSGMDVARSGRDRSVIAMWEGKTLVDIKIIKDTDEQVDTAEQADVLLDYMKDNVIGDERSAVDGIGVGVGVIDSAKKQGRRLVSFVAGAASTAMTWVTKKLGNGEIKREQIPLYNNLRSQVAFQLAEDIEKGEVELYEGCPFLSEFKKEATMHNFKIQDRQMILESKDKVKERLGHSPDVFDAVVMGYWLARKANNKSSAVISAGPTYDSMYEGNGMDL